MKQFETWLAGQNLKQQVVNPNIEVGDHSYYSGFYHDKSFEEQAVRYLLGDSVTQDEWNSGVFGEVDKLRIGKFVSIASGATFMMAGNQGHRIDWISTFPFDSSEFGDGVKSGFQRAGDTVIGNDVWVGSEAMIMPGVRIGDGAVIGAQADGFAAILMALESKVVPLPNPPTNVPDPRTPVTSSCGGCTDVARLNFHTCGEISPRYPHFCKK